MRGKILFLLILGMLTTLVYCVGTRVRDPHVMPQARATSVASTGAPPPVPAASSPSASVSLPPTLADPSARIDARAPLLDRPLRIAASSWEAGAALLVANGGHTTQAGSAMHAAGLELEVSVVPIEQELEAGLARGGSDPDGVDLAVLTLPSFVASYERLRALEPQVMHLAAWSRGREGLLGVRENLLARPEPFPGDVSVASSDPSSTLLALFALDETGTSLARVHVATDPKDPLLAAQTRPFAVDRPSPAPSKILLTTADTSRLVPVVAVAARSFIDAHSAALAELLKGWVRGGTALRADVPAAARQIATQPGAPDPEAVLERLGWMMDPGPGDEAFALGVAGKDLVNVEWLFARQWRLLRDQGALTSPTPPGPLVATQPFSRAFPIPPARAPSAPVAAPEAGARTLLAHRVTKGDAAAIALEVASLASLFERSALRVSARPAALAKEAASLASATFGIEGARLLVVAASLPDTGVALIEVLAGP